MSPTEPSIVGLTVIVEPDKECSLDVVFVHGFTGHPKRTWTAKKARDVKSLETKEAPDTREAPEDQSVERPSKFRKYFHSISSPRDASKTTPKAAPCFWPQDLLPQALPQARVMTYGYDTHLRHALGPSGSKNTVYDVSKDFVTSLEAERRSDPSRPLLFVAHSLGGIVVKEALRQSRVSYHRHLQSVYNSTAGVFFFGTPHSGADPRGPPQHLAERIVRAAGLTVNDQVVNTLLPSSERLRELRDEFGPLARERNWIIYSFQESIGVKLLNGDLVVENHSSCLNDSAIEIAQHIHSNHMDMCRFEGPHDSEWKKVSAALDDFRRRSPKHSTNIHTLPERSGRPVQSGELESDPQWRQALLDCLIFEQIDAREATIRSAHTKTCQWLLEKPEYHEWLDSAHFETHHGLLWMRGNPGTGKSTMMKYALAHNRKANTEDIIIAFFFNARGDQLERSTHGMYRSLLLQLLESTPGLESVLRFHILRRWSPDEMAHFNWGLETLKAAFEIAITKIGSKPLKVFVDALDECPENEIRDMVGHFEELGSLATSANTTFRVFFSSRHYPHITVDKAIYLTLEEQEEHEQDIEKYVKSKLKARQSKLVAEITREILQRASGIFLWVVLVIDILNKDYDRGRVRNLTQRLRELPSGLKELFEDILLRDSENVDGLILCLQWILFAKRPLKREELYFAVLCGLDSEFTDPWDPEVDTKQAIDRFIRNSSKGLAEVTKSKSATVQFIHESVRDFLLKENGFGILEPRLVADLNGQSHERLKEGCMSYMAITSSIWPAVWDSIPNANSQAASDFRSKASQTYPFLKYAVDEILFHADCAESSGIHQDAFLDEFPFQLWLSLKDWLARHGSQRHTDATHLIHVLAEDKLIDLVPVEIKRQNPSQHKSADGKNKNKQASTILRSGDKRFPQPKSWKSWLRSRHRDPLRSELCDPMNFHLTCLDLGKRSALHIAVKSGAQEVVATLLSANQFDVNARDSKGWTPLCLAAESGHESLVRLLLESGKADPIQPGKVDQSQWRGFCPIHWAADRGHTAIVRLLIEEADVDPNTLCNNRQDDDPFSLAAAKGRTETVNYLLSTGKIHMKRYMRDPFTLAAEAGHVSVVEAILNSDAFQATKSDNKLLVSAAQEGHLAMVILLLESSKFPIGHEDQVMSSALEAATRSKRFEVTDWLFQTIELSSRDTWKDSHTLLCQAASQGDAEAIKRFLKKFATDDNLPAGYLKKLVDIAVARRQADVLHHLLNVSRNGFDLYSLEFPETTQLHPEEIYIPDLDRTKDFTYSRVELANETLLTWAVRHGLEPLVKVLVARNGTQAIDVTTFMWSVRQGDVALTRLLLQTGQVDVNQRSDNGFTPLLWTAVGEQEEMLTREMAKDRAPRTPAISLFVAKTKKSISRASDHLETAKMLRDLGHANTSIATLGVKNEAVLEIWKNFRFRMKLK